MTGSNYCFVHNPETHSQHIEAARKGGSNANKPELSLLPKIKLSGSKTVLAILEDAVNRVRAVHADGSMDVATANAVGHLCGKLLEAYKVADLESRITELESAGSKS